MLGSGPSGRANARDLPSGEARAISRYELIDGSSRQASRTARGGGLGPQGVAATLRTVPCFLDNDFSYQCPPASMMCQYGTDRCARHAAGACAGRRLQRRFAISRTSRRERAAARILDNHLPGPAD